MAREEWMNDIQEGIRRERWSLIGPNRIVKVVALGSPSLSAVRGYICTESVLMEKTPAQIGKMLGAKTASFDAGVKVYRLTRLPMASEFQYELTTKYPDGLFYNPIMHDSDYLPGAPSVHQWCLTSEIPAQLLRELKRGECYPR